MQACGVHLLSLGVGEGGTHGHFPVALQSMLYHHMVCNVLLGPSSIFHQLANVVNHRFEILTVVFVALSLVAAGECVFCCVGILPVLNLMLVTVLLNDVHEFLQRKHAVLHGLLCLEATLGNGAVIHVTQATNNIFKVVGGRSVVVVTETALSYGCRFCCIAGGLLFLTEVAHAHALLHVDVLGLLEQGTLTGVHEVVIASPEDITKLVVRETDIHVQSCLGKHTEEELLDASPPVLLHGTFKVGVLSKTGEIFFCSLM